MQKSLGEATSWADRKKLTQSIFTHIRSNLFPKNDYKWAERKQGEEGIYANPEITESASSGSWKAPLSKMMKYLSEEGGTTLKQVMSEAKLSQYEAETLIDLVRHNKLNVPSKNPETRIDPIVDKLNSRIAAEMKSPKPKSAKGYEPNGVRAARLDNGDIIVGPNIKPGDKVHDIGWWNADSGGPLGGTYTSDKIFGGIDRMDSHVGRYIDKKISRAMEKE